MMRFREKTGRRVRRRTRKCERRDRDSEPLRVLVRILAREAAREWFAGSLSPDRPDRTEVTVQ